MGDIDRDRQAALESEAGMSASAQAEHRLMNVVLTGFMGAGKTTTGKRLAKLLGLPFFDTDTELEARHGPISHIFGAQGELAFRRLESEVVAQITTRGPAVIAVGGGAILDPDNRTLLRHSSYIVHLAISARSAHRRVSRRRHRPLLGEAATLEMVSALLEAREKAYADCDLSIRVDRRSASEAAQIIARWYGDKLSARTSPC
jgi:shikimate kinase